jgi:mannose-1-phosphate guanylyltransferase
MLVGSVLFAAGRGTRLRPLTEWVPKPAIPLLDVPLVAYSLARVAEAGAPIVVNASHLAPLMANAVTSLRAVLPTVEVFVEEPGPYGGGGTLRALRDRLADPVVTYNADVLADLDVASLLATHDAAGADATIAVRLVARNADFVTSGTRAVRLVDRAANDATPGALFLGAAVLTRRAVDLVPDGRPIGLATTVLGPLARAGRLALHVHDGYWRDAGTPGAYLDASLDVLYGRAPQPPGGVPGEVVEAGGGRAYLGAGCDVEHAALGPGAIVLAGASIGPGARVEDAIVWPGERVPAGEVLARCVWARGVAVPAPVDPGGVGPAVTT